MHAHLEHYNTGRTGRSRTWVGLTLIRKFHTSCPVAKHILPNSHQPEQNWADGGIAKIKVGPSQVGDLLAHPVGGPNLVGPALPKN